MNRRSSFRRTIAGTILAVCFLPVVLRAESNAAAPDQAAASATEMTGSLARLTAVETTAGTDEIRVFLETSGKVDARSFVLASPDRLVVDLPGVESVVAHNRIEVDSPYVSRVRVGQRREGATPIARVVLDLKEAQPYAVEPGPGGVVVTVGSGSATHGHEAPAETMDAA